MTTVAVTKTGQPPSLASSSVDVVKGIQAQLTSLAQWDELKKVGTVRSYPLEWDFIPYPPKFKSATLHSYDGKTSLNRHIYYFRSQTGMIDNDAIMAKLFIGTLKGVAFDWFKSLSANSIKT